MTAAVANLYVYPVKSCVGIPLQAVSVGSTGFPYDRHWMIVRESNGKAVTQRQIPKLCQVSVSLPPEALMGKSWGQLQPGASLVLSAPGMPQLQVPLVDTATGSPASTRTVTVWEWTGLAADEGDEAAAWFSKYLGVPVRLVRHIGHRAAAASTSTGQPTVRAVDPEFAPGHEVEFADGFPLLVTRTVNLDDLNARMSGAGETPLPMNRFRPNIVLSGGGVAWSDDNWQHISITPSSASRGDSAGSVTLQYVKPSSRCKVTTINQSTAEEGREPLSTLGTFRTGKMLGYAEHHKDWTHGLFFGWNATVNQQGFICIGDAVGLKMKAST